MSVSISQARAQLAAVRREQEAWARERGWEADAVADVLSPSALTSSFFRPFRDDATRCAALAQAMGLDGSIQVIDFARACPTGMRGAPPSVDVLLDLGSQVLGLQSRFTEWMIPKAPKTATFDVMYLQRQEKLWFEAGLPRCQKLAEAIASGELQFAHVDALQLLKQALGLRAVFGEKAALGYLYLERAGDVGLAHVRELDTFTSHLSPELAFRSWTYQELVAELQLDQELKAFADRYFPQVWGRRQRR